MSELYAGVDLGGTTIKCVLGDAQGHILFRKTIETDSHAGPERVLSRIGDAIQDLTRESGTIPQGLGMGVPGLVDGPHGITRFLPNLTTHWVDVPAAQILSAQVNCPVRLLNDVRMATLGELVYGRGKNVGSMVFIAIGTGIGGGVVLDGKLRLGPLGAA